MIDSLKSLLNSELVMLPFKFAGEDAPKVSDIEAKLGYTALESFETQKRLDHAKRLCTRTEFRVLLASYLAQFISSDGFDVDALEKEMAQKREMLKRHLGKDWVYFLSTMIRMHNELEKIDKRPRGLIRAV